MQGGIITKVQQGANLALFSGNTAVHVVDSVISPGVIDVHVHLNEPGRVEWEGEMGGDASGLPLRVSGWLRDASARVYHEARV